MKVNLKQIDKREYNSERRRKLSFIYSFNFLRVKIRENITPRGDGNPKFIL